MRLRPALIAVLVLSTAAAGPAVGQRRDPDELARLQSEYRDEMARARRLRADAREAAAEVVALDRRLAALGDAVEAGDKALAAQRARLDSLNAREAALGAQTARERGRQGRLLTALQMMGRRPPPPLLVPAARAVDTVRASILLRAVAPTLQARARALADRQVELARVRRLAVLSSEALITGESAQGDRRAEMEALSARKRALEAVLRAEAEAAERAAAALEARIRALGGETPTLDAAPAPTSRRPGGRDRLTSPGSGAPVERFGGRSQGWRWSADAAPALAPASGRVLHAGPLHPWGQVVILDLGPGWRAVVAGLDSVAVEAGDRVEAGQTLGRSAPDGEVYFELRRDERPVDPAPWLDGG